MSLSLFLLPLTSAGLCVSRPQEAGRRATTPQRPPQPAVPPAPRLPPLHPRRRPKKGGKPPSPELSKTALGMVAHKYYLDYKKHKTTAELHAKKSLDFTSIRGLERIRTPQYERWKSYAARDKAIGAAKKNTRIATVVKGVEATGRPEWLAPGRPSSPSLFVAGDDKTEGGGRHIYEAKPWAPNQKPSDRAHLKQTSFEDYNRVIAQLDGDLKGLGVKVPASKNEQRRSWWKKLRIGR